MGIDFAIAWSFEPAWVVGWAALLAITCLAAWGLNLIALPGNWISIGALSLYVWLGPETGRAAIGIYVLVAALLLAVLGELLEFAAAAVGAKRAGASRRSTLYALIGSVAGAILGAAYADRIPEELTPAGRLVVPAVQDLPDAIGALLGTAVPLQLLTERLARERGVNPDPIRRDNPRYLRAAEAPSAS